MSDLLLPPILYWSPSLAEHANREAEADIRHGLIDATDANILMSTFCGGWTFLREMPADAVQLVDYVSVAEVAIEWGVRWPMPDIWPVEPAPDLAFAENNASLNGGHVVQREVRRGQWKPVAP